MNDTVNALAASGSTLYAGGSFLRAGGLPAKYIAQWNGSSWSPLGSGMDARVNALAVSGNTLYAGGSFNIAGTNSAVDVAEALLTGTAAAQPRITSVSIAGTSLSLSGANGPSGQTFYVLSSTNVSLPLNQ